MKKIFAALLTLSLCCALMACGYEAAETEETCGHEQYLELIAALEEKNYDAVRALIDDMEGKAKTVPMETAVQETVQTETTAPTPQAYSDVVEVELTRQNLLDYFELREDYIFEGTVRCYQNFQLREEYKKRLVDILGATVEISYFAAKAYGELDHGDQLFFADRYDQITGELEYLKTEITKNGEGYLSVGVYDTKKGCFDDYLMDIAITEVTGKLVLSEE